MTAGSAAHALLAFTPAEEVTRLLPSASFTARTLLDVRRRGWAHSVAEREPGWPRCRRRCATGPAPSSGRSRSPDRSTAGPAAQPRDHRRGARRGRRDLARRPLTDHAASVPGRPSSSPATLPPGRRRSGAAATRREGGRRTRAWPRPAQRLALTPPVFSDCARRAERASPRITPYKPSSAADDVADVEGAGLVRAFRGAGRRVVRAMRPLSAEDDVEDDDHGQRDAGEPDRRRYQAARPRRGRRGPPGVSE